MVECTQLGPVPFQGFTANLPPKNIPHLLKRLLKRCSPRYRRRTRWTHLPGPPGTLRSWRSERSTSGFLRLWRTVAVLRNPKVGRPKRPNNKTQRESRCTASVERTKYQKQTFQPQLPFRALRLQTCHTVQSFSNARDVDVAPGSNNRCWLRWVGRVRW